MKTIQTLARENKELFWDIGDISKIDDLAIEERFLKYGNWDNIKKMKKIIGKEKNYLKRKKLFEKKKLII